jgi:hypothetical protein
MAWENEEKLPPHILIVARTDLVSMDLEFILAEIGGATVTLVESLPDEEALHHFDFALLGPVNQGSDRAGTAGRLQDLAIPFGLFSTRDDVGAARLGEAFVLPRWSTSDDVLGFLRSRPFRQLQRLRFPSND